MAWHIIIIVFYLLLFNYLIYRFPFLQVRTFKPAVTCFLFNLKFLTGIFIWAIYTFYYTDIQNNDVHKFYNDAQVLYQSAFEHPHTFVSVIAGNTTDSSSTIITSQLKNWERNFDEAPFNENRTCIRLNTMLMFLSFKTYFVHILAMCFISLIGWVLLINSVFRNSASQQTLLAIVVMLLPSVLFWSSGVMKEPLLILGLGVFIYSLLQPVTFKTTCCMAIGFVIILISKFFILAALAPASIAFVLAKSSNNSRVIIARYASVIGLSMVLAFTIQYAIPRLNPQQMLVNKQQHLVKEAEYFNAGSRIAIPALQANTLSIIKTIPVGIWNTLMRPYLWEGKNIMMLASAFENLLVLLIVIYCLAMTSYKNFKQLNTVLLLLVFSVAYFALIGICTPVLGSLVRYRAPVLPFFLFGLVLNVKDNASLKISTT